MTFVFICLFKMAELMRRYAEKRLQEEKDTRQLVQQVSNGHKNVKVAKQKLHAVKQRIGEYICYILVCTAVG